MRERRPAGDEKGTHKLLVVGASDFLAIQNIGIVHSPIFADVAMIDSKDLAVIHHIRSNE
jgi:hypothetical protein